MNKEEALLKYALRLGDNALILAQRLVELVAHGPELEEEMANANFALDYLGQARMFYSYAGELEGKGRKEDDFAFLRDEREFCSFLLVEQPNGHFGDTIVRSVLFEEFYASQLRALAAGADERALDVGSELWLAPAVPGRELGPAQIALIPPLEEGGRGGFVVSGVITLR